MFKYSDFFSRRPPAVVMIAIVVIIVIAVVTVTFNIFNSMNRYYLTDCEILEKESVSQNKDHEYRVYTEGCGVLVVKDSLLSNQWDSADEYRKIRVGNVYDFYVEGGRYPILTLFPNIIDIVAVRADVPPTR